MKTITGWKDISTKQYIQLYNLKEDDYFEMILKQIGIIYEMSQDEVENIPLSEFNQIKNDIAFMAYQPEQYNLKKEIVVEGKKYLLQDLDKLTLGEWADLESYNGDCINNLHSIMAVLYRKEGITKYIPSEVDDAAQLFLDKVDIETTLAAFFLFYLFGLNFIQSDIKDCSMFQKVEMEMKKKEVKKLITKGKQLLNKDRKTKKKLHKV
jgi:hypothetical protein